MLRSTFQAPQYTSLYDVEVVGSYAYLSISEYPTQVNSLMIVNIADPTHPTEVGRVGNTNRVGMRVVKGASLNTLYALAKNAAPGAVELWSIANPIAPSLVAVNATLNPDDLYTYDELRAINSGVCVLQHFPPTLSVYATSTYRDAAYPPSKPSVNFAPATISPTTMVRRLMVRGLDMSG